MTKLTLGYMPHGTGSLKPFNATFDKAINLLDHGFEGVDAIIIWGGEDISSSYYNERPNSYTQNQRGIPSKRDVNEWNAMRYAKLHHIPIIGVCRGAQFLCVFSGGKLVQHVVGHNGQDHTVTTVDGEIHNTTSCHHQMMYPFDTDYQLLAWTSNTRSGCYLGENNIEIESMAGKPEPEVVYFPKTNGLAIQGHPEWMPQDSTFCVWLNELVKEKLLKEALIA